MKKMLIVADLQEPGSLGFQAQSTWKMHWKAIDAVLMELVISEAASH